VCRFRRSWRTKTARCCVLMYLELVRVDTGCVRYLRVVKNISFCDLIFVVQVLDLFNIVYNYFSNYLCVEFFICVENSSSNHFRILSCKFSEMPIYPLGASLVLSIGIGARSHNRASPLVRKGSRRLMTRIPYFS